MHICYIIGASPCDKINIVPDETDYVICADGGLETAQKSGIVPNLTVGDFDSYGSIPKQSNIIVHPTEKDETDSLLAVNCALERGYKKIVMYGMLGGRLDHTFANIQLLSYIAEKGAAGVLLGCGHKITAIKNSRITFDENEKGIISVFSLSEKSTGVTISGLKYELNDAQLSSSFPLGISNEFCSKKAYIEVKNGTLILISEDKDGHYTGN